MVMVQAKSSPYFYMLKQLLRTQMFLVSFSNLEIRVEIKEYNPWFP